MFGLPESTCEHNSQAQEAQVEVACPFVGLGRTGQNQEVPENIPAQAQNPM